MDNLRLEVKTRKVKGKENKKIRKEKAIPAVVYGRDFKAINIQVAYLDFEKIFKEAGESSLIDLAIDGKNPIKVIMKEAQVDPATDRFIHADFHHVKMTEKITTEITLKFIGEPKAVKDLGGVLVKNMNKVEVECLASDLIHEIEVELLSLNTFDDIIKIKDLIVPENIKLMAKDDEVVAKVIPPRTDAELEALEEEVEEEVEKVEGVKEEKEEGEEGEEGTEEKKEKEEKGEEKEATKEKPEKKQA